MRKLGHEGKKSPLVRHVSVLLTQDIEQKNKFAEIYALYNFVKDRIRYVRDIRNVETLHTAERILQNKAGDCDDKSILLASLLESLGFKTRFNSAKLFSLSSPVLMQCKVAIYKTKSK